MKINVIEVGGNYVVIVNNKPYVVAKTSVATKPRKQGHAKLGRRRWTKHEEKALVGLVGKGYTVKKLAKHHNRTKTAIKIKLAKMGIK